MPLWGNTGNSSGLGAPNWPPVGESGNTGIHMYGNVTLSAFSNNEVIGVFAVDNANAKSTRPDIGSPGWVLFTHGTGPVQSITVTGGEGFVNGDSFRVSGGTLNATGTVVTNATGNLTSVTIANVGAGFANQVALTKAFLREKHLATITVAGSPVGYHNTNYIVVSNGTVNARATFITNATGEFDTANVTITSVGRWANTKVDGDLKFTVFAANGAASNGTGVTLTGTLVNSTGGTMTVTLGGRADRLQNEVLVSAHVAKDAGATLPTK